MKHFDIVVIGAGSGGVRFSRMASGMGANVAVIESTYLGGTCVNVGCVPKKLFVIASHFGEDMIDAAGFGWSAASVNFDWNTLKSNKDKEINRLNTIYKNLLGNAGVTLVTGLCQFKDKNTLSISDDSGTHSEITADKIVIATGSTPYIPEILGKEWLCTSTDMFYLESLPQKAVVWGGGYIAVEFAGILNGLGVDTHLVYRGDLFLRGFDEDIRQFIKQEMTKKGVHLHFSTNINAVDRKAESEYVVELSDGKVLNCNLVMAATGRVPLTSVINLEAAGVALNQRGEIAVDDHFKTSQENIYAIGDVIGGPQLTPVALAEGMALAKHLVQGADISMDYDTIPTAIFTLPNIGTVGLSEQQARQQYSAISVYKSTFTPMKHTLTENEEKTFMKMLVDKESDKVLGVHMVGDSAGEIIQGIAVALKAGATKAVFDSTIGIHPTAAEEFVTMRTPV
ncbi:MAG: glutathione-disulfide reductase [Gammaproteobacteria bacterium]|nr:MAG: glutathione-disulfide reductase [Gammaproteobacteria bacterium]